ncbi:hypothetical protein [Symbiopectobacterium sp. RP]|uniref:hypothetical protein n=1 Tax=Symbiopectobacterium sp. RP TaxID=3248553 RepID=UPI003D2813CD
MGTSKKQKKREWLRYRDFVLSPYGVIKIKSLGYINYANRGTSRRVAFHAAQHQVEWPYSKTILMSALLLTAFIQE